MKRKAGENASINRMAFFSMLGPIILNGINFFTIPIFTNLLGTDGYGMYTIYITWLNILVIFVSMQVQGTIGVANVQMPNEKKQGYYSSIATIIFISFGILMFIFFSLREQVAALIELPVGIVGIMMIQALGMAFVNFETNRFTYEKKAHKTFFLSVSVAVGGIILSLALIGRIFVGENVYVGRIIGYAIPYIIIGGILGIRLLLKGKVLYSKEYWKFCLTMCIPIIFHGLSHLILGQADKIMLQKMLGESIVGIFGFTVTFSQIMNIIYNALNTTWVAFYYDDLKNEKFENIKKKTQNYVYLFTSLSIGFILLAPEVIKLFAGKEFWSGIETIPMLVLGNYMIFLYSFPVNYEFYHRKTVHIALGTSSAAILNCVFNYLMIPVRGMQGAAEATFFAYFLLWIFHHLVSKYTIRKNYHYKVREFIPGLCAMIGSCIIVDIFQQQFLVRWILAIIIGGLLLRRVWKTKSIF